MVTRAAALVFVRLAHDWRFVGVFLFLFVLFVLCPLPRPLLQDLGAASCCP